MILLNLKTGLTVSLKKNWLKRIICSQIAHHYDSTSSGHHYYITSSGHHYGSLSCFCMQVVFLTKPISCCTPCSAYLSNWKSCKYKFHVVLNFATNISAMLKLIHSVISHVVAGLSIICLPCLR